jgi:pyridoxal biosynthesis lyase PdxS
VVEAVRHMRTIIDQIHGLTSMNEDELFCAAKDFQAVGTSLARRWIRPR